VTPAAALAPAITTGRGYGDAKHYSARLRLDTHHHIRCAQADPRPPLAECPHAGRFTEVRHAARCPVRRDDGPRWPTDHRVSPSKGGAPMTIGSVLQLGEASASDHGLGRTSLRSPRCCIPGSGVSVAGHLTVISERCAIHWAETETSLTETAQAERPIAGPACRHRVPGELRLTRRLASDLPTAVDVICGDLFRASTTGR
jgi:hypothetical protein